MASQSCPRLLVFLADKQSLVVAVTALHMNELAEHRVKFTTSFYITTDKLQSLFLSCSGV